MPVTNVVGVDKRLNDFRSSLVSSIENSSVNEEGGSLATGTSPLISPDSLKNLSSSDLVVLVEEVGLSRYEDIAKMLEVCSQFGVKVLGTVVLN